MYNVVIGCVLVVLFAVVAGVFLYNRNILFGVTAGLTMMAIFFTEDLIVAPKLLGWGHVPTQAEGFTQRLSEGVLYRTLSSHTVGADQVILVQKEGTGDLYAIRVKGNKPPPEHFTLVDGKPVKVDISVN